VQEKHKYACGIEKIKLKIEPARLLWIKNCVTPTASRNPINGKHEIAVAIRNVLGASSAITKKQNWKVDAKNI
jgi:hypothetical protein